MPWYKLTASHGSGHQGSDVEYRWDEQILDAEMREELWDGWVSDNDWDWPIGDVVEITMPPEAAREQLLQRATWEIKRATAMIERLSAPTIASTESGVADAP